MKGKKESVKMTVELPKELAEKLDLITEKERTERSAIISKAIVTFVKKWKVQSALEKYKAGEVTLWKAAKLAEVSLWKMIDLLREREIPIQYSANDFMEDVEAAREGK